MLLGHDRVRELAIRSDSSAHAEKSKFCRRHLIAQASMNIRCQ